MDKPKPRPRPPRRFIGTVLLVDGIATRPSVSGKARTGNVHADSGDAERKTPSLFTLRPDEGAGAKEARAEAWRTESLPAGIRVGAASVKTTDAVQGDASNRLYFPLTLEGECACVPENRTKT